MFLKFDMRQGHKSHSDMQHDHFLISTGDIGIKEQQTHATLAFIKINRRHGHPPSRAPTGLYSNTPNPQVLSSGTEL